MNGSGIKKRNDCGQYQYSEMWLDLDKKDHLISNMWMNGTAMCSDAAHMCFNDVISVQFAICVF